jgi:hypothetical protein
MHISILEAILWSGGQIARQLFGPHRISIGFVAALCGIGCGLGWIIVLVDWAVRRRKTAGQVIQQCIGTLHGGDPRQDECTIPPAGWRCTRGVGHTGPCAAVPYIAPEILEDAGTGWPGRRP